jgi:hypothetical protein
MQLNELRIIKQMCFRDMCGKLGEIYNPFSLLIKYKKVRNKMADNGQCKLTNSLLQILTVALTEK